MGPVSLTKYSVVLCVCVWARQGSNLRPKDYESPALTTELRALVFVYKGFGWLSSA